MADIMLDVEVAYALPDYQQNVVIKTAVGSTVLEAINASGIVRQFPEIDLSVMAVGVFAKVCQLDRVLEQGDRIEIYRPLKQNPMDARRNRAKV